MISWHACFQCPALASDNIVVTQCTLGKQVTLSAAHQSLHSGTVGSIWVLSIFIVVLLWSDLAPWVAVSAHVHRWWVHYDLSLVQSDHMTQRLASHWSRVITWPRDWPLIGPEWSHDPENGLSLGQVMASIWWRNRDLNRWSNIHLQESTFLSVIS